MTLFEQFPAIFGVSAPGSTPSPARNEVGAAPVAPAQFHLTVTPLRETAQYRDAVGLLACSHCDGTGWITSYDTVDYGSTTAQMQSDEPCIYCEAGRIAARENSWIESDDRDPADVAIEHNARIHGEASHA
jgi:hypothetical protein